MRRKDREVSDPEAIQDVLRKATVCRIGLSDGMQPYVVPVCFGYDGDRRELYFHSAREGRKLDILAQNDLVCFEVEADAVLVPADRPCRWSMRYASVIGFGRARIARDAKEKRRGLEWILRHYGEDRCDVSEGELETTTVVVVAVSEMTCKASTPPPPRACPTMKRQ